MNLFSSFDPNVMNFSVNWISSLTSTLILTSPFWLSYSQMSWLMKYSMMSLKNEFSNLISSNKTLIFCSLFFFIMLNNFMGLFPYVFTSSTHFTYTLTLSLPLWIGHMIYSWIFQPIHMLAHLTPLGTPYLLQPLMVLIELVSNIIRPLTLAIRLAANMVAGHLLLTLIGSQAFNTNFLSLCPLMLGILMILTLESAVAIIQAYVFSILSCLYLSEVDSLKLNKYL